MAYIGTADVPAGSSGASLAAIVALVRDAYSIKSVADATARAQAVTDWPTLTGAPIGVNNPVMVWRQDTDAIEVSENGTTWTSYAGQEDVTSQLTLASGSLISAGGWTAIRTGKIVTLTAQVGGGWAGGEAWTSQALLNIPVGLRPNRNCGVGFPYYATIGVGVSTAGVFYITTGTGSGTNAGTYDVSISWTLA